jgi:fructosamine-3-kinase
VVPAPDAATWQAIAADLSRATGSPYSSSRAEPTGGGSINQAFRLHAAAQRVVQRLDRVSAQAPDWVSIANGEPAIFDPAVYYGDREADLAMTELFGGFPQAFYRGYHDTWPLDPGYRVRKQLYNLYHLLNHLNLFGGSYLAPAQAAIDGLLCEIRG